MTEAVDQSLETARTQYQQAHPNTSLRVVDSEPETNGYKLDHLLYLPLLGLTRPRDLYYYQGEGLKVLHGFTYKYLPLEHFLGQLTRLQVGRPLADTLAQVYSQAWYPGDDPLALFVDWHIKPHWTKHAAHSGPVTMWGRVMPGTKQLLLNGPEGHLLGGWNEPIDAHLTHVLGDLEADLATRLQRPIAYTICDSEGSGLPLAERYAAADAAYLTVLPRRGDQRLAAFEVLGTWEPVDGDPDHEAASARWSDPARAQTDPRDLVLMRRVGETDPTRVYVGRLPEDWTVGSVPGRYRQRWPFQERVIRELVNGANLNANFGYTFQDVPDRTQQRRWAEAQARVETSERDLAETREALAHLGPQLRALRQAYRPERATLEADIATQQAALTQRQAAGQTWQRVQQGLERRQRRLVDLTTRFQRRRQRLVEEVARRRGQRETLRREVATRQAVRDGIDTATLCRERDLEKDQILLNFQVLLRSLHDWARAHYFAPEWQHLELDTATELIYRKSGRVQWGPEEVVVTLDPYRYPEHQQAMEASCRRFNAAQLRWRDGRWLRMQVDREPKFQLCDCQGAGQT